MNVPDSQFPGIPKPELAITAAFLRMHTLASNSPGTQVRARRRLTVLQPFRSKAVPNLKLYFDSLHFQRKKWIALAFT
jgi:hypothetical protein